jgi:hypothetical protein
VAAFVRIGWPLSIGIGGRLPSESVAALPRIPHTVAGGKWSDVAEIIVTGPGREPIAPVPDLLSGA